ncbi:MAG: YceI family protein [Lewinellaceae bacterium]|nr:YceI family protein [Lewinellaceae bacterium]
MKKHLLFLSLLGLSLVLTILAIQCKPASSGSTPEAATTDSTTMVEPETGSDAITQSEPETATEPVLQSESETTTNAVAKPEAQTKTGPGPNAEPKKTAEPTAKMETTTTTESAPKPEPKPTAEPAPKTETPPVAPPPAENKAEAKTSQSAAAPVVTNFSVKSAKGVVDGTSSLHEWDMEITKIECKGAFQYLDNALTAVKNVEVKILVEGMKSKEGKIMNEKTYKAFESDKNPYITYTFSNADVKNDGSGGVTFTASGSLKMAGTTKPVSITAKGKVLANGDLQLSVSKKLDMTEFNMAPPTALMGTIKVGPEVTVGFDLVLAR